jgi:hypothetical protein
MLLDAGLKTAVHSLHRTFEHLKQRAHFCYGTGNVSTVHAKLGNGGALQLKVDSDVLVKTRHV